MGEDDLDIYTKDGTIDYHKKPANKNETGTWKACPYILGNECCERLAYYGMSSNLVKYFKYQLHQHSTTAANNVSNWSGTCYITPLIGAFLADAYLGRYWTIACVSIVYVIFCQNLSSFRPLLCSYFLHLLTKRSCCPLFGYNLKREWMHATHLRLQCYN